MFLLIYSISLSLWFAHWEGRNGGQHVPGRRYVCQCGSFYQRETVTVLHLPGVILCYFELFAFNGGDEDVLQQRGRVKLKQEGESWCIFEIQNGSGLASVVATAASRQLAKWLAGNVNIFHLFAAPRVSEFLDQGIQGASTRIDLTTRRVFQRLLTCYHGQSEAAFVFATPGMQPLVRDLI